MQISLRELFKPDDPLLGGEGSNEWNREVVERAYGGEKGPVQKIRDRISLDFSGLVYVPGNCMTAVAEFVKRSVGSREDWSEYGKHPGKAGNITNAWMETCSMVDSLRGWLTGKQGGKPKAIFYNLDLLSDGRGGIYPHDAAQTALFSLIESTRLGVVLGLADRDAGRLPGAIERAFAEHVWVDEIPFDRFPLLIPIDLGEKLMTDGKTVPAIAAWLIASRLRFCDPIRAVKIMQTVARQQVDLMGILRGIWEATRNVEFIDPDDAFQGSQIRMTGFPKDTLDLIENNIIRPFRRWANFAGTEEECKSELKKLTPGLILYGPPGTGKTYLARWIAKSIGLPIRVVRGADIKAGLFGEAEKNVHRLFDQARRAAPCVIVLDDADDLLPDRSRVQGSVAGAEIGIVDAVLQELDGFLGRPAGVLVVIATNRFSQLDRAVKRRIKLHVLIPYPLDQNQIGEIIDSIAEEYRFKLNSEVHKKLIERFMGPVVRQTDPPMGPINTPDQRKQVHHNLFSPSEIQQALLFLDDKNESKYDENGYYYPTVEDVRRMEDYYEGLVQPKGSNDILK